MQAIIVLQQMLKLWMVSQFHRPVVIGPMNLFPRRDLGGSQYCQERLGVVYHLWIVPYTYYWVPGLLADCFTHKRVGIVTLLLSKYSNTALCLTLNISQCHHEACRNWNTHVQFASNLMDLYSNTIEATKIQIHTPPQISVCCHRDRCTCAPRDKLRDATHNEHIV